MPQCPQNSNIPHHLPLCCLCGLVPGCSTFIPPQWRLTDKHILHKEEEEEEEGEEEEEEEECGK